MKPVGDDATVATSHVNIALSPHGILGYMQRSVVRIVLFRAVETACKRTITRVLANSSRAFVLNARTCSALLDVAQLECEVVHDKVALLHEIAIHVTAALRLTTVFKDYGRDSAHLETLRDAADDKVAKVGVVTWPIMLLKFREHANLRLAHRDRRRRRNPEVVKPLFLDSAE